MNWRQTNDDPSIHPPPARLLPVHDPDGGLGDCGPAQDVAAAEGVYQSHGAGDWEAAMSYKLINKGRTPCGTYWTIEVNRELYRASAITAPVTGPEVLIFPADAN